MAQVYYEKKFHPIVPTTSKSKDHYLVHPNSAPSGKIPKSDQAVLCMYREGDIVKYEEDFYKIVCSSEIKPHEPIAKNTDGRIEIHYKVRLLVDKNNITGEIENNKSVEVNQDLLIRVLKTDKERIQSIEFNLIRYNSSIFNASYSSKGIRIWINPQFDTNYPPRLLSLPETMKLLEDTNIRANKLIELGHHIRQTHRSDLQLLNVLSNPFRYITPEWQLFNFDAAWYIAYKSRLRISSEEKMEAFTYSLAHEENSFYILSDKIVEKYSISQHKIHGNNRMPLLSNRILVKKTIDYLEYYTTILLMNIEKELSDLMVDLFHEKPISLGISEEKIDELIHNFENEPCRFTLNHQQRAAVKNCLCNRLSTTIGYPGTGKSTIMECVFYIRARINKIDNISISAPTGIAFKTIFDKLKEIKIGERTVKLDNSASGTVHKCVYVNYPNISNSINREIKIHTKDIIDYRVYREQKEKITGMTELSLIVIDEISMLDIFIFKRVLLFCKRLGCQLILIGDSNQLPSVGPGAVLKSILESGIFDDNIVKLNKICRQNTGALLNGILKMANGKILGESDFDESSLCFRPMREYEGDPFNIPKFFELFDQHSLGKENTKVICFHSTPKQPINTVALNTVLQERYNPTGKVIPSPFEGSSKDKRFRFRVGDTILLTQNGEQENDKHEKQYRVNGDEATILDISPDGLINIRYMTDIISGSCTQISNNILYGDYILSYALTVHKSQGSQYDNIVFLPSDSKYVKKELVFTAISRAKQKCIVLANMDKFKHAQTKIENKPTIFMKEFITTEFE
jgi:exodeoxyribonuclease V alpha subunit